MEELKGCCDMVDPKACGPFACQQVAAAAALLGLALQDLVLKRSETVHVRDSD